MLTLNVMHLSVEYKNKRRDTVKAVNDVSFCLPTNSFNVIVGYSGCGKSTLLKAIAGLLPYSGDILYDGIELNTIDVQSRNIAFVQQEYALYPNYTVFDNIANPLKAAQVPKSEIIERVTAMVEDIGLGCCLSRKPRQLSGGQQQRVALARALVKRPSLCLFDEPLSNIDANRRMSIRSYVKQKAMEYSSLCLYVTHDFGEAMALADNLIVMDEGKIILQGKPIDIYNSGNSLVESLKTTAEI